MVEAAAEVMVVLTALNHIARMVISCFFTGQSKDIFSSNDFFSNSRKKNIGARTFYMVYCKIKAQQGNDASSEDESQ